MNGAIAAAFLAISVLASLACLLVLTRVGFGRLESAQGIERDGPKLARDVSPWQAVDVTGVRRRVPHPDSWTWLVFADHCLESFPVLVDAINALSRNDPSVQVVVLPRTAAAFDLQTAERLGIGAPIVLVDQGFYDRYNVRVMPYSVVLDGSGIVIWKGLVHTQPQIEHILGGLQAIEGRPALASSLGG